MSTSDSVKVELFIKPSELDFILKILDAFRNKKVLEFNMPQTENGPGLSYGKYITEGASLTENELLELVNEAEKSEKISPEEFRKALGI